MRIAVDIDGVLYEWDRTARYMLREYCGYKHTDYGLDQESDSWDYIMNHVSAEDWRWLWTVGIELGLFRYGHVTTGAIVGLNELLVRGHDLLVVTHRPKDAIPDTMEWLAYQRIPWSEVRILSRNENKADVDANIFIDDKPENIYDIVDSGKIGLLFDRPWNQAARFPDWDPAHSISEQGFKARRVRGWDQVCDAVSSLTWEGANG